jgi:Leucine-rich repeat (LRR) protein
MKVMSRAAVFAALVLSAPGAFAEDSIFPDKNLETAVRRYVFAKRESSDPITKDDVKDISEIVARKRGIKDLSGLEHCRSIMLIDFAGNEISDLSPLQGLKKLQSIDLARNKIKDLSPLAELKATQLLEISGNEVEDLGPVAGFEKLRDLWAADNKIKNLEPVKELKKLWFLDVAGNKVDELKPIAGLKEITNLDLRRNQITELAPLAEYTELRYLLLDHNKVSDLAVLVSMSKQDAEKEKRFAPFLHLHLAGNPLSETARTEQVEELKKIGVRVLLVEWKREEPKAPEQSKKDEAKPAESK